MQANPPKLIIMSATLQAKLFTTYFSSVILKNTNKQTNTSLNASEETQETNSQDLSQENQEKSSQSVSQENEETTTSLVIKDPIFVGAKRFPVKEVYLDDICKEYPDLNRSV